MDAVVLGILHAAIVDAAPGHDHHIAVFPDIKVVIYRFGQAGLAEHHGNMNAFVFRAGADADIQTAHVRFRRDLDVFRAAAALAFPIDAEIIGSLRHTVQLDQFFQHSLLDLVHHVAQPLSTSLLQLPMAESVPISCGRISSRGP
jgi:hypothetical protein